MELPELPEPVFFHSAVYVGPGTGYTADQMRSYALEAVRRERERCAKICEDKAAKVNSRWIPQDCADAIRSRSEQGKEQG